jgi:leader peptidase (prepilin peptidase)/N-methyltransferase
VSWYLDTAAVGAAVGLLSGWWVPALIARIPEPPADPDDDPVEDADRETKQLYVDIAASRGLAARTAVATAVVAAVLGGVLGWTWALSFCWFLAPVGVALALVDWRTRLLPTKVIAPSYGVVVALVLASAALSSDWHALATAGWGWLVAGGTFFVLWFVYPKGMGYGDVRLAGLLGIALGYLGWPEIILGVYAAFLIGAVGGVLLSLLRIVDRKAYPFGPFLLVGAVVGVLAAPAVTAWYA